MKTYMYDITIAVKQEGKPRTERSVFGGTIEAKNDKDALRLAEAMYKGHINTDYGLMRKRIMELECKVEGL